MRALNRLSASFVTNVSQPGKYLDGGGLVLAARKSGTRAWLFRYQRNGVARGMGLGSLRSTSLAAARERADTARRKLAAGIDPINERIGERQQQAAAAAQLRSVREVAALFFAKHQGRWAKERDWKRSLDLYVHPVIGNVAIADVGVPHVLKVVEPHWARIPEIGAGLAHLLVPLDRELELNHLHPAQQTAVALMLLEVASELAEPQETVH